MQSLVDLSKKQKYQKWLLSFIATLKQMMFTIFNNVILFLATARVMQYSGMIAAVAAFIFSILDLFIHSLPQC